MFGVIYPNKPLFDLFGEGYVAYGDSEYQLNVGKWGIGSGVKLNPFHHKNWSLNTLFRYSFANSVTVNEYVHSLGTYGINLNHQSVSTNINLEGSFSFDFYRGKKKSKAVNQFYFGCGGDLLYHKTNYNYTVKYSFQPEGRHDVNRDNGWFVVPTIHLGYRIGIDL